MFQTARCDPLAAYLAFCMPGTRFIQALSHKSAGAVSGGLRTSRISSHEREHPAPDRRLSDANLDDGLNNQPEIITSDIGMNDRSLRKNLGCGDAQCSAEWSASALINQRF